MAGRFRVSVVFLYTEEVLEFEGPSAEVCAALLGRFGWLRSGDPEQDNDLEAIVEALDSAQALEAVLEVVQ